MAGARLDAIGIVVGDLAKGIAFYRLLGAPFAAGAEESEHDHAEAVLDGGIRLMLDSEAVIKSFDPEWRRGDGQLGGALAFRCENVAAVDELYRKAIEAGARSYKAPWDAFWGQRYAQLRDPDGNPVDLYADLQQRG